MSEDQGRMGVCQRDVVIPVPLKNHPSGCVENGLEGPALGQGDRLAESEVPQLGPIASGGTEWGTSHPALPGTEGLPRLWDCQC